MQTFLQYSLNVSARPAINIDGIQRSRETVWELLYAVLAQKRPLQAAVVDCTYSTVSTKFQEVKKQALCNPSPGTGNLRLSYHWLATAVTDECYLRAFIENKYGLMCM
jgi:hypothetical protein